MRKAPAAAAFFVWGATLIATGIATGSPEPIAKYGATGSTQLVFGLAYGVVLVIVGGWTLLHGYRRRRNP
jgi:hypothetical protein